MDFQRLCDPIEIRNLWLKWSLWVLPWPIFFLIVVFFSKFCLWSMHLDSLKIATVPLRVDFVNHRNRCVPLWGDPWLNLHFLYCPGSRWMSHLPGVARGSDKETSFERCCLYVWYWMPIPDLNFWKRYFGSETQRQVMAKHQSVKENGQWM